MISAPFLTRSLVILGSLLGCCPLRTAAQQVLINEVMPANRTGLEGADGGHPDWIELVCVGRRAVDLQGYVLSTGPHHHRINAPLRIAPGEHRVLLCDDRTELGPSHLALRLPRNGGTLMLIAPDGSAVLDLFTWPALPPDVSIGRCPDGSANWGLFPAPTPGHSVPDTAPKQRILPAPDRSRQGDSLQVVAMPGATVRYTTDGSAVTEESPALGRGIPIERAKVVRARAYAPDALPGPEALFTAAEHQGLPAVNIAVDPADLWDPERGIIGDSAHANYAMRGAERRASCLVGYADDTVQLRSLGLAIAGSGTRSAPKRSFKLFARARYGEEGPIAWAGPGDLDEVTLRADASPNAFLRNLFIEHAVHASGLQVDMPTSRPCTVHLNGEDQGLYRILPPKNGDWLQALHRAGAIDLADGPGAVMLRGDRSHLDRSLEALVGGAPAPVLDSLIDLRSLIDLACIDLYTGRADHDLNVRCWRPRQHGGRWRWILFDMDLWAPPMENSVDRMCNASLPETPYIPQLLGHRELAPRFLARLEACLLTVLSPARATTAIDSLYNAYADAMAADDERWSSTMERPSAAQCRDELLAHVRSRPERLLGHLAERQRDRLRTFTIDVPPATEGALLVEGMPLDPGRHRVTVLTGVPLRFEARPANGHVFAGWAGQDHAMDPTLIVGAGDAGKVKALFRPVSGHDGL